MKKIILWMLLCLPMTLLAQTDKKYLEGSVPVIDGKVKFTTEITAQGMSKEHIFQSILEWANKRYQPIDKFNARVIYQNQEEGQIAVYGEEYIVFTDNALVLDRSRIYYQLQIFCDDHKSKIDLTRISYWYNETREDSEKFTAEEWITDEFALKKSKDKLYPINGKFRKATIDLKDQVFEEIYTVLEKQMITQGVKETPATPQMQSVSNTSNAVQPAPVATAATDPTTIISQATRMTITAGNDEQIEVDKDCWGGFGELFGKKVTFCLIDTQKTMSNMLLSQSNDYKISFYLPNSSQAALVIECKKVMQQNISGEEAKKMSSSCSAEKTYNMYVGEFIK